MNLQCLEKRKVCHKTHNHALFATTINQALFVSGKHSWFILRYLLKEVKQLTTNVYGTIDFCWFTHTTSAMWFHWKKFCLFSKGSFKIISVNITFSQCSLSIRLIYTSNFRGWFCIKLCVFENAQAECEIGLSCKWCINNKKSCINKINQCWIIWTNIIFPFSFLTKSH